MTYVGSYYDTHLGIFHKIIKYLNTNCDYLTISETLGIVAVIK